MKRIKLKNTNRFYLDELLHPNFYNDRVHGGAKSIKFLNNDLVNLLIFIREHYKMPITINNWATGGKFINSGVRDAMQPLGGKLSRSRHYLGMCLDLKFKANVSRKERIKITKFVHNDIINNEALFMRMGLTVLENIKHTPTWLHISVEQTELDHIKIINP